MIYLREQYGFKKPKPYFDDISDFHEILNKGSFSNFFKQKKGENLCYRLFWNIDTDEPNYFFEASYYIGTDWIVENKLPIHIQPKLNNENLEIDYLKMLIDSLDYTENHTFLEDLYEIKFNKPLIEIEQSDDMLSPLLVVQYLYLLKRMVQKGLKKSYYRVTENINSRVKGKVLVYETVKRNLSKNKNLQTHCSYETYGVDTFENRILKKALVFARGILGNLKGLEIKELYRIYNYIYPAFSQVGHDVEMENLKKYKPNPIYSEYKQAIYLAKLILKKYGYNISKIAENKLKTPPYWIDMSKLFELYVYSKLKAVFPKRGEVKYKVKAFYRELDFLIKSEDGCYKMVVDAKYKPRYSKSIPGIDDIRQVTGYARLKEVYQQLDIDFDKNIDCLIVHPDQSLCKCDFTGVDFKSDDIRVRQYVNIYNLGISLPTIGIK